MRKIIAAAALAALALPVASQTPQQKRNPHVLKILEQIKGQEDKPAGEVFKNVQQMKDFPAKRLLAVMEIGYSRSLGVDCDHCHVVDQWDADDLRPKRAAREMSTMVKEINALLAKLENLEVQGQGKVNCSTCHRGSVKPALDLK